MKGEQTGGGGGGEGNIIVPGALPSCRHLWAWIKCRSDTT